MSNLCPTLLLVPVGASTLWPLATPMGLLFVFRGGPQSTFPVVPRGERAGWFFPSCRTMAFLSELSVGVWVHVRRCLGRGPSGSQRRVGIVSKLVPVKKTYTD